MPAPLHDQYDKDGNPPEFALCPNCGHEAWWPMLSVCDGCGVDPYAV